MAKESTFAQAITVESAGLIRFSVGKPPDRQAQRIAKRRGVDLAKIRARVVRASDVERFDWIMVMTHEHRRALQAMGATGDVPELRLLAEFAVDAGVEEVPDPYGESDASFEAVYDLIESGCRGLLDECERRAQSGDD